MRNRAIIFSSVLILSSIMLNCGVGGVESVAHVPHNISIKCIERYLNIIDSIYKVPDSLAEYKIEYDFLDIHHYYFADEPRAIYMVDYISGTPIRYIYDIDGDSFISQQDKLSKGEKKLITDRFMQKVIEPIYEMALKDNLGSGEIFSFVKCQQIIVCDEYR